MRGGEAVISRVFKNNWFERYARKEQLSDAALLDAVLRAEAGLIDADLGGGVIKQRVARPGKGKSGGYRTLILFREGDRAIFAYGFAKSAMANIPKAELTLLRKAAAIALEWSDAQMDQQVELGKLVELDHGQDDDR